MNVTFGIGLFLFGFGNWVGGRNDGELKAGGYRGSGRLVNAFVASLVTGTGFLLIIISMH